MLENQALKANETEKLTLKTSIQSYDIFVGSGLIAGVGELARAVNSGQKALIITDSNVMPLYGELVKTALSTSGFDTDIFVFKAGEARKTLDTINLIYQKLAELNLTRKDLIVALGGGVTGDMAGFAAATWLRGIDFVQIPTTLLAQVDSSVGGKTGVDIPAGKNLVGAFWQPKRVIVDIDTLKTLSPEIYAEGMAEIIKAACIKDSAFFDYLKGEPDIQYMVSKSIDIKRRVVEADEREAGERKLLNFGHTLAHALEKHYDFKYSHGNAVSLGMIWISQAAENAGLTPSGVTAEIISMCEKYHLPTHDKTPFSTILPHITHDKKRAGAGIDLVLLEGIGKGIVYNIELSKLADFIEISE